MTNEKRKITIGLDLGIASVGWSILDSTNKDDIQVLNLGVRLFEDPSENGSNEDRRTFRSSRRRKRRLQLRKKDLTTLFIKYGLINGFDDSEKLENIRTLLSNGIRDENDELVYPLFLKLKGLKEELSKEELMVVLYSYLKHRGSFYMSDEQYEQLQKNKQPIENKNLFPSQIQYENYLKEHKYMGLAENANFKNEAFVQEIQQLFTNQSYLSKEFQSEYLKLFTRKRSFAYGPGSLKSPTPYGMYYRDATGKIVKKEGEFLWETNIGRCSVYLEEKRGLANSPICETYNLLNDLANLKVSIEENDYVYLTLKQKINLLNLILQDTDKIEKTNLTITKLCKYLTRIFQLDEAHKITKNKLKGLKEKNLEPIITNLSNLWICTYWLLKLNCLAIDEVSLLNIDYLNKINELFLQLAKSSSDVLEREKLFRNYVIKESKQLDENVLNQAVQAVLINVKGLSKTASYSYKAMLEFIHFSITNEQSEGINNSVYFYDHLQKNIQLNQKLANRKYFPKHYFDKEMLSTTAKRTFNQAINVINKIFHLYAKEYTVENIVIEMAREKNTEDQRKIISQIQRNNLNEKEKINDLIHNLGYENFDLDRCNSKTKLKIILWAEQNFIDVYDGLTIDFNDLMSNANKYHVDHIIPYSYSYTSSRYNLALTKNINNSAKTNNTPYLWLKNSNFSEFKERIEKLYPDKADKPDKSKYNKLKKKQFLNLTNIHNPQNQIEFIERNLVDTRIATKLLLESLQAFFSINSSKYPNVKIKTINGSITNYARYNLFVENQKPMLPKNRDDYRHHAIDAAIIGYIGLNKNVNDSLNILKNEENNSIFESMKIIDKKTGEIIEQDSKALLQVDDKNRHFGLKLKEIMTEENRTKVKFSTMIVSHYNMQLFADTIYGLRTNSNNQNFKVSKIHIMDSSNTEKLKKYFNGGKDVENLLLYQNNKKIYNKLNEIYIKYLTEDSKKNPFILYNEELKNNTDLNQFYRSNAIAVFIRNLEKPTYISCLKIQQKVEYFKKIRDNTKKHTGSIITNATKLECRIYKNKCGEYVPVNIDSYFLKYSKNTKKKLVIDENSYNSILEKNQIINNSKFIPIKHGTKLILDLNSMNNNISINEQLNTSFEWIQTLKTGLLFEFIGSYAPTKSAFVLNLIDRTNGVRNEKNKLIVKEVRVNIETLKKYFKFCEVDELGNIYNKKTLDQLWNELK